MAHASYGETVSILVVEDDVAVAELIRTVLNDVTHWGEPPVLLMWARPEQADIAMAMRDGMVTAFLAKPFDVDALVAEVHKAVSAPSHGAASDRGRDGSEGGR